MFVRRGRVGLRQCVKGHPSMALHQCLHRRSMLQLLKEERANNWRRQHPGKLATVFPTGCSKRCRASKGGHHCVRRHTAAYRVGKPSVLIQG